jgi:fibronectin-binding autotransporter adhesin
MLIFRVNRQPKEISRRPEWRHFCTTSFIVFVVSVVASATGLHAATLTWTGATNGDWNTTSANWAGGAATFTAGDAVTFNDSATGTTSITISAAVTPSGTVTISNTTKEYSFSGPAGLVGTLSLLKLGPGPLAITSSNTYSGVNATVLRGGTTTLSGNAIVTSTNTTANTFNIGTQAGDNATLVIKDSASITSNGLQMANNSTSRATVFMQGGTFTIFNQNGAGSNFIRVGASGSAAWSQTGGLVTVDRGLPTVGRNGGSNGQMTVSSGTFRISGTGASGVFGFMAVGYDGAGVLNLAGDGVVETGTSSFGRLLIVNTGTGSGTVNLDGGSLRTRSIATSGVAASTSTLNFNSGTLVALASTTSFLQGLDAANVKAGGAVIDTNGFAITVGQNLLDGGGNGGLTKMGDGTLTMAGTSTYTGPTTIVRGVLAITATSALPGLATSGAYSVAADAGLAVGNAVDDTAVGQILATGNLASGAQIGFDTSVGNRTYSMVLEGNPGLVKLGGNTLTLSASNGYTGTTTIGSGVLQAADANALGAGGTITLSGGTLQYTAASAGQDLGSRIRNSTAAIRLDTDGNDVAIASSIDASNTGGLTKLGPGTLTLAAANTYSGVTTVSGGTLTLGGAGSIASSLLIADAAGTAAVVTITGGTVSGSAALFRVGGSGTGTLLQSGGLVTLDGMLPTVGRNAGVGQMSISSGTFRITGTSGALQVGANGAGTLTISGDGVVDTGTGSNMGLVIVAQSGTSTGAVNLDGGTLRTRQISTTAGVGGASTFAFNGGTLVAIGSNATFMQGLSTATVNTGGAFIDTAGNTVTISQNLLNGGGGLTKHGAGTLVLAGTNTYVGATTVQEGTIQLAADAALAVSQLIPLAGSSVSLSPLLRTTVGGLDANAGGLTDVGSGLMTVTAGLSSFDMLVALTTGRGDGSWDGMSGITSSQAEADIALSVPRTVGWLDNGDGSVTFAFAAPGDTNLDWQVDVLDATNVITAGKFNIDSLATWAQGDFNYDGVVNVLDVAAFLTTGLYDQGLYNPPPSDTKSIAAVPEPSLAWHFLSASGCLMTWLRFRQFRQGYRRPCSCPR